MPELSERGAEFIGRYEGFRASPYNDAVNNATIGFGHLIHMGPVTPHDVSEWGSLSEAAAVKLLQKDASVAEAAVEHYIKRKLAQHERDALISFAFNCGGNALGGSVGQQVNAGHDPTAALEQWDHAGGKVLQGLLDRRKAEAKLYTAGEYGDGRAADRDDARRTQSADSATTIPHPVPPWAWKWAEWKLGRAEFRGHAGDPAKRESTGAPAEVPPWAWVFLKKFQ